MGNKEAPRPEKTDGPVQTHASIMTKVKRGVRPDLGEMHFRSAREANVARYFNLLGLQWEYEPDKFVFEGYTTAPVCYTPDFKVLERNRWWYVEVKGHWRGTDREKLRRLKKQHPDAFSRIWIITSFPRNEKGQRAEAMLRRISTGFRMTDYRALSKQLAGVIPDWES